MKYVPSNITTKEFFNYYCTDDNAKVFYEEFYEETLEEKEDHKGEIEKLRKRNEILSEQIHFAEILIESIEEAAENANRLNEFKKSLKRIIENSLFES